MRSMDRDIQRITEDVGRQPDLFIHKEFGRQMIKMWDFTGNSVSFQ